MYVFFWWGRHANTQLAFSTAVNAFTDVKHFGFPAGFGSVYFIQSYWFDDFVSCSRAVSRNIMGDSRRNPSIEWMLQRLLISPLHDDIVVKECQVVVVSSSRLNRVSTVSHSVVLQRYHNVDFRFVLYRQRTTHVHQCDRSISYEDRLQRCNQVSYNKKNNIMFWDLVKLV